MVEEGIETEGSRACAFGGAADVWKGWYNGTPVAIKSLRICWPQGTAGEGAKGVDRGTLKSKQVRLLTPLVF